MDNEIICELTTFSASTTIHYPDGTVQKVPTGDLSKLLVITCNLGNFSKVKFICDNKDYVNGIIENAKIQEKTTYGFNNIDYSIL